MFGFEYCLRVMTFYVWFRVSFDTQYVLFIVPRYGLILYQRNVGAWSKVVLNAPGPPRGFVVLVVHPVHSDPL